MSLPPGHFVPITPTRWQELCRALRANPAARRIRHSDVLIAWRAPARWYVDPVAYKAATGTWPDGYWRDA